MTLQTEQELRQSIKQVLYAHEADEGRHLPEKPVNECEACVDALLELAQPRKQRTTLDEILRITPSIASTKIHILIDVNQAKKDILQWVNDEVVRDNLNWSHSERMQYSTREIDALDYMLAVNSTKDAQRVILKQHGWKGEA